MTRRDRQAAPLLLGHRGAPLDATENTLAAFASALAQGADGIELDVRRARDGALFVFHDPDLARLTGLAGPIEALDATEVRDLRVGAARDPLPALGEALALARDNGACVNVELKPRVDTDVDLARDVARALGEAALPAEAVRVSCFDAGTLGVFASLGAEASLGALLDGPAGNAREAWARFVAAVRCRLAPHPAARLLRPRAPPNVWLDPTRAAVWTVDDPDRACHLAALGVEAIISNRPGLLRAAFAEAGYDRAAPRFS